MPLIDWDDIQAEENRRREVAVKAGASPRATKYEDSPLKQMVAKAVEEAVPDVADEFAEYKKNTPLPWYNFVATPVVKDTWEEVIERNKEAIEEWKAASEEEQNLQAEARENEMKITRTSTGQPKVENNSEVPLFGVNVNPKPGEGGSNKPDTNPKPTHPIVEPDRGKPGEKPDNTLPEKPDPERPTNKPGEGSKPGSPSPIGSGDARASQAHKDNK